jgi:formylglycine-generating enzyme required for sulfatase activity
LLAAAPANDHATAPRSESLADRVRLATQLVGEGDAEQGRAIITEALQECESGVGDPGECALWSKSLQGLRALADAFPEKKTFVNSLGMKFVRIPAGEFFMGSPKGEMDWLRLTFKSIWREGHKQWFQDELPLHPVRHTKPYYMGVTEVTVGQFRQFVKETKHKTDAERGEGGMIFSKKDNRWVGKKEFKWDNTPWRIQDDQPVVFVSWNDAVAFCKWLSRKEKRTYRLPTEAEWERACRGGSLWRRYPWGDRLPGDHDSNFGDGEAKLPESLTTVNDGYQYVSSVGSYPANGFGLYDMSGNVMEWVQDRYDRNYYENSPVDDPQGPPTGNSRVNKGGNFYASPADDRCAFRGFSGPEMSFWNLGFRVVMEDPATPAVTASKQSPRDGSARTKADAAFPPSEGEALQLFREAVFSAQQQQWDQAVQRLEDALNLFEERKDYLWVARVRATLAGVYAEQNRAYKAKELYTKALAEFRKVGDQNSARIVLARLGELGASPGVKVVEVQKGSIAEKAGIVVGDVILEYGGETGFKVEGFKALVNDHARTDKVTLSTIDDNDEIHTMVVAGGPLGVAVEDIKRRPRPQRPPQQGVRGGPGGPGGPGGRRQPPGRPRARR